jgi:hypothetical protein
MYEIIAFFFWHLIPATTEAFAPAQDQVSVGAWGVNSGSKRSHSSSFRCNLQKKYSGGYPWPPSRDRWV